MSNSSARAPSRSVITTQDIIDAQAAHGDDFMIIDIDGLRQTTYAQYGNIYIKKADGDVVWPRYWKLSGQGVTTTSAIKEPTKRCFAQTRIGLCQVTKVNDEEVETDNMKAMKLLCETYESKMDEFKQNKVITDNKKDSRKQPDGTMRPVTLVSTKVSSPMDTMFTDRETGETKDREHPYYWISLPNKRFYNSDEVRKESVHFDDQYYFDAEKNAPDLSKPIMTFEYQPTFYNIDDFIHHPRTGKKIYKKLGYVEEGSDAEAMIDNTNIHKYLTKGSAMVGNMKFEIVITGRGAKMDISLYGSTYVRQGVYSQAEEQDDECLDEFTSRYSKVSIKKPVDEDMDEPDLDDF
jgi:hypothetical protein